MKARKSLKCLIAMVAMAVAFTLTGFTAEAKTKTDKMTMLTGEKISYSYIGMGTLKSVKSSKKSVVTAKKSKGRAVITAKKKGSANVTSKGTRGTWIHKITVKKFDVKVTPKVINNGEDLLLSVKNNTSCWFDAIYIKVYYRDSTGTVVTTSGAYMDVVGPKDTACGTAYIPYYYDNIDYSKTTYSIDYNRTIDAKYTNYEKKVKVTTKVTQRPNASTYTSGKIKLTAKPTKKYKGKGYIYVGYDVKFYDAAGNIVDVYNTRPSSIYKGGKKSVTTEINWPYYATSYKVTKRIVEKQY